MAEIIPDRPPRKGYEADVIIKNADGVISPANPLDVSASIDTTGLATSAKQDTLLTELQLKADLTETQPVSVASLPLPSGAATAANQQTDALTNTQLRATPVPVSGSITVSPENVIDANNSTTTPLGISAAYTGTATDVLSYASISITLTSDKSSTAGGMKFQFSTDGTNWDDTYSFDFVGGTTRRFQFPVSARYFRVFFTNTNSAQTYFRVQTILHTTDIITSIHRIDSDIAPDRSAQLMKTALIAQINGSGDFTPIQANAAGVLKIGGNVGLDAGTNNIGDVDVLSSALPTGAATSVNQTTIIGHLDGVEGLLTTIDADTGTIAGDTTSIDSKIPALGQALAAGSVPVVLPAAQITTLTPPAAITGFALETGGNLATIAAKDFATQTTLAAINAKLVTGTDIGDVTINNSTGAAAVNIQDGGNTITVDGTVTANLSATDNTVLDNIDADTSAIQTAVELIDDAIKADDAAFTPGTTKVMMAGFEADETTTDSVDEGDAGAARMTLDRKQIVTIQPHTAGGLSRFRSIDLDETEEEVKATSGQVYGWFYHNKSAATVYIKYYNATAANVTVGTTTPVETHPVPAGASANVLGSVGIIFDTAITVAATTGVADNDTGAPAANDCIVNIWYK